jgi:hypothetical protein
LSTQHEDPNNPNNPAAGISGGVCVNHLWPVVAGGGGMKDEALKLALEALEHCRDAIIERGLGGNPDFAEKWGLTLPLDRSNKAITAIKQALAAQPAPVPLTDKQIDAEFEVFASKFNHESNEWLDMGVDEYFRAGFRAAAPAAQPAVPDAIHHTDLSEHPQYIEGWNDCRAEMLKGMEP